MLYDKILVAVDGSEQSNRALKEALRVAQFANSKITLIHVYPMDPSTSTLISATQQFNKILKDSGKTVLEQAQKVVAAECEVVDVEALELEGDAVEQIIQTAKDGKYNLIVLGARGVNKLSGFILGSVSQGVVKNAPCPVLIVK